MMEPEPEICVPDPQTQLLRQASYTNNTIFFYFFGQVVLIPQPEPKALDQLCPTAGRMGFS